MIEDALFEQKVDYVKKFRYLISNRKIKRAYSVFEENPEIINSIGLNEMKIYYKNCFKKNIPAERLEKLKSAIEKRILEG